MAVEQPILCMYVEDLGFPKPVLEKYIRDPQEARDALRKGGLPILAEVIIKNWACHYFKRDMIVNSTSNHFGFDVRSVDGEITIEVKTAWVADHDKYASFLKIKQKKNADGSYAFSHIAFYSPFLGEDSIFLFNAQQFEEVEVLKKTNIKIDINEGWQHGPAHNNTIAFEKVRKKLLP